MKELNIFNQYPHNPLREVLTPDLVAYAERNIKNARQWRKFSSALNRACYLRYVPNRGFASMPLSREAKLMMIDILPFKFSFIGDTVRHPTSCPVDKTPELRRKIYSDGIISTRPYLRSNYSNHLLNVALTSSGQEYDWVSFSIRSQEVANKKLGFKCAALSF